MQRTTLWRLTASLVALLAGSRAMGRQLATDPEPPVRDGLVVWLDASSAQPEPATPARASGGGTPLAQWVDRAAGRVFEQPDELMRPTLEPAGKAALVRFGGRGQHLLADLQTDSRGRAASGSGIELRDVTVLIVAAPQRHATPFGGLMALHAAEHPDYQSGLNIDLGAEATTRFSAVNVEGAGCSGPQNLRTRASEFGRLHRVCVTSTVGPGGVRLYINGQPEGQRDRQESVIRADRMLAGARYTAGIEGVRHFFAGDIAEALVFDRVLREDERRALDEYLANKYEGVVPPPPPADDPLERRLVAVESPPPLQMFVPGFTVRELPVNLTNVNNVLYREDGVLVALAYDGNVYLLRDTDGDGLEDQVSTFWKNEGRLRAPIGMALTPPGYSRGRGVFVPSKSKVSLLLDADGDDVAEQEIIVAEGWRELWTQVDALGVAVDPRDESILFGLGTWNFADGYQVNDQGVAEYRLDDEHGTILRVSPNFQQRKIVCTGIRFPVALRFNKDGELFCTDQEGATWLPNGNPFDELLHVQEGRHYGFPPRHPRLLPGVVDEPSVFDYRPQHQSTCGMNFNEPASDGSIFGPPWWRSDALITGYSRGKLYRTKLARTEAGFVAQNQLIATGNMLLADACVAPGGSLVLAAHSGGPDWGSGPSGAGKLFKATYAEQAAAIPALVWAQSPREVRVAFDRPVDPALLQGLAERARIDAGEFVAAGDRFESLRPGYAIVARQAILPRFAVEVQGVQLAADRRTLIIATAQQRDATSYSIALPTSRQDSATAATASGQAPLPQRPDIDLQFDHCGVEAVWQGEDGQTHRTWLPHLNTAVARDFTRASAEHEAFWERTREPGTLTLRTSLDLHQMLRPAVQPGGKLDYEPAPETVTIALDPQCDDSFAVAFDGKPATWTAANKGVGQRSFTTTPGEKTPVPIEVSLRSSGKNGPPSLDITFHTGEDSRPRALPLNRFLLPWAQQPRQDADLADNRSLPELQGGSWLRGQKEFFGSEAGCSKCHAIRGQGGRIGPELSNLPQRDYASVLRDVTQPSFAINPDYVSQTVLLKEGRVLTGIVKSDGERLIIADTEGKEAEVGREEVEAIEHSAASIMPEGIPKVLGPLRMRDLLTFLLVEPPRMPVYGDGTPPPPRPIEEVQKVLAGATAEAPETRPLHVTLVTGPKDHAAGEHDYPAWQQAWRRLLEMADNVRVTTADGWPSEEDWKTADAMVFYQKGDWTRQRAQDLDAFLARGGGATFIHFAVSTERDAEGFAERLGLAWYTGRAKYRHGPLNLQFVPGSEHPIARNFDRVHFVDESYWKPVGDANRIDLLATGIEEGAPRPLFWTRQVGQGRIFVSVPGHYAWTFDDPLFRILLLRGIAWSARESVDRFNDLVLVGARVR